MTARLALRLALPLLPFPTVHAPIRRGVGAGNRLEFWIAYEADPDRVVRLSLTRIDGSRAVLACGMHAIEVRLSDAPSPERFAALITKALKPA